MDESSLQKPEQQPPTALRASDADRDRVADILREALAEGRLTHEEHSERIDAVYTARTLAELEPLVRDLPGTPAGRPWPAALPAERAGAGGAHNLVAVFGGASRKGRWRIGPRTNAFACFGGIEIDLTEALFEQRETVINVVAVLGGVDIKVPENVTLRCSGTGVFGGFDAETCEAPDPDAPVVLVRGVAVLGGASAKPQPGKRLRPWARGRLGS